MKGESNGAVPRMKTITDCVVRRKISEEHSKK